MNDRSRTLDAFLVLEYRSGKSKALDVLVKKYHIKLCKHAYWFTHDIDSSKDIVQDSWKSILSNLYKLREPEMFGSWAFKIVTRKALDQLNKQKIVQQELQKYKILAVTDAINVPIEERAILLQKAVLTLPTNQQLVLRLFYLEGYSLKEMSQILEISMGTVKSRLFYGREKLKTILKHK